MSRFFATRAGRQPTPQQQEREVIKALLARLAGDDGLEWALSLGSPEVDLRFERAYEHLVNRHQHQRQFDRVLLRLRPHPTRGPEAFHRALQSLSPGDVGMLNSHHKFAVGTIKDVSAEKKLETWFGNDFLQSLTDAVEAFRSEPEF